MAGDDRETHQADPSHAATDRGAAAQQEQVKRDHDRLEESARRVESSVPSSGAATDAGAAEQQDRVAGNAGALRDSARRNG